MSTKFSFNRKAYFRRQGVWLAAVFILSLFLDLLFVWYLTIGLPINVADNSGAVFVWKMAFGFLLLLNGSIFKIWNIYVFIRNLKKRQTGYIEITTDEIVHCEEQRKVSQSRVLFQRGYVSDKSKKMYEYILIYRICQVYSYKKDVFNNLYIRGIIEIDCLDEYNGLEMGVEDHTTTQIMDHRIPAYYEGMETIQLKLDEMASKQKRILCIK